MWGFGDLLGYAPGLCPGVLLEILQKRRKNKATNEGSLEQNALR